jgi:hypothetical protein
MTLTATGLSKTFRKANGRSPSNEWKTIYYEDVCIVRVLYENLDRNKMIYFRTQSETFLEKPDNAARVKRPI